MRSRQRWATSRALADKLSITARLLSPMPKPVYILCSESGSEDKTTGLVSHFKVLEQIELRELPKPPEGATLVIPGLSFQMVAVWAAAEDDDLDQKYECTTTFFLPPDNQEQFVGKAIFSFEGQKRRARQTANFFGLALKAPGLLRIENRIRPLGAGEDLWLVQSYEIPVIAIASEGSDQSSPT